MQDDLTFTGERYMPTIGGNIFLEHMHRYKMALHYVADKEVLDIASGEGFGSNLLATVASHVTGVDISAVAVEHARRSYGRANLEFLVGSVTEIPIQNASVDVVVSFETIGLPPEKWSSLRYGFRAIWRMQECPIRSTSRRRSSPSSGRSTCWCRKASQWPKPCARSA